MNKGRLIFVMVWSFLSLLGMMLWTNTTSSYLTYFLLGFHTPRDIIYFWIFHANFSDCVVLLILYIVIEILFIVIWAFALLKLKTSKFFEYLIFGDRAFALINFLINHLFFFENFDSSWFLIGLLCENVIILVLLIKHFKSNKTKIPSNDF